MFDTKRLTEEKEQDKRIIISVSLNKQEQEDLKAIKDILGIENESKALKFAAFFAKNVLLNLFGEGISRYLFKKKP